MTLEVAKQGAIYHGLATLLQQPSPVVARGGEQKGCGGGERVGGMMETRVEQLGKLTP